MALSLTLSLLFHPAHICYPPGDLLCPFSNSPTSDGLVFPSPSVALNQHDHDDGDKDTTCFVYYYIQPWASPCIIPLFYLTGTTTIAGIVLHIIILFPIINLF